MKFKLKVLMIKNLEVIFTVFLSSILRINKNHSVPLFLVFSS